eukprot:3709284-Karenia_brevis.AAC.1
MHLIRPYEVEENVVQVSPSLQQGPLVCNERLLAGTDASGGEHTADPRLRRVGWAAVIFGKEMSYLGAIRGNLEGAQTVNRGELMALVEVLERTEGDITVAVDSAYV